MVEQRLGLSPNVKFFMYFLFGNVRDKSFYHQALSHHKNTKMERLLLNDEQERKYKLLAIDC